MAFKKQTPPSPVPDSPEKILLDLPRRRIAGVLLHQGEAMKTYAAQAVEPPDVALQLPTGSGKTLVALLIGEWRRRKFGERVLYLCPTKQLVHQVAEQAVSQYGLNVTSFVGPKSEYSADAKSQYFNAERIAVTVYQSLFNVKPFFETPNFIVVDDAHVAENYIASAWSFRVDRHDPDHKALHSAISGLLKPLIGVTAYKRLVGTSSAEGWVEKVPSLTFDAISTELTEIVDEHATDGDLLFRWQTIRDHLDACHLYYSGSEILIRPLVPPTFAHAPFVHAKQRLYMSATLGAGGDLERLTGRRRIHRLPAPDGWDQKTIGRRYFVFPGAKLDDADIGAFRQKVMALAGRSVVLAGSDSAVKAIRKEIADGIDYPTFTAQDIEQSRDAFLGEAQAVTVIANRYDGIDFPGDSCRVLFVEGLQKATNLQERFLMSRMGALALFNERVQTRILQGVGRCTRSLQDYSAVILAGDELTDYFSKREVVRHLHPEFQAELQFGLDQSRQAKDADDLLDNIRVFLDHGEEWEEADAQIVAARSTKVQESFPALNDLAAAVEHEVEYQESLWQGDYKAATSAAESVLGKLDAPELRGYRAWWHYLAGSAAMAAAKKTPALAAKAKEHFREAKAAAKGVSWLVALAEFQEKDSQDSQDDSALYEQLERVEKVLERLGTVHDRKYAAVEKEILEGLSEPKRFEAAQQKLGELLGFDTGKIESDGSPDPWWLSSGVCIVFEDHADAQAASSLDVKKARQVATHPNWIRKNVPVAENAEILPVLVTPVTTVKQGAVVHLDKVFLWSVGDYQDWARAALSVVRKLRQSFTEPGELFWRADAADAFRANKLDVSSLKAHLQARPASAGLKVVP